MAIIKKAPGPMKVKMARVASVTNLCALALSAIFYLMGIKILGLAMLIVALAAFCFLLSTGVYRIAGGQPLDDIEREQMQKAYAWSYWVLGCGLIVTVLLVQIFDQISQYMNSEGFYEFLFWSLTSLILVLPAAALAWKMPTDEIEADD